VPLLDEHQVGVFDARETRREQLSVTIGAQLFSDMSFIGVVSIFVTRKVKWSTQEALPLSKPPPGGGS